MKIFLMQTLALTKANMRVRYRGTMAGFIWVIINPIALYLVQSIVFKHILKLNVNGYSIFLLGGLLPWIFITLSLDMASGVFREKAEIIRSIKFNPLILPVSIVLDNFFNFFLGFILVFLPSLFYYNTNLKALFLLPIPFLFLLLFVISIVAFIATLNCFFMDTKYIVNFVLSLLFFATPIFYPKEFVPGHLTFIYELNPIFPFIELFRQCVYHFEMHDFLIITSKCIGILLISIPSTYFYFKYKKNAMVLKN